MNLSQCTEGDLEVGPARPQPLFCNHLFFCDYVEELHTVFIEFKLIINNVPLTYVYPNTIKTYLTPNHLLFGRQLSSYSSTTSAVIRNLTVLSSTTDKINRISNHFWHRWRHEYVVNLCETQRASKLNINSQKIMLCQFMMKRCSDTFGKLPQYQGYYLVEFLTQEGVTVRIKKANAILKCPVNKLFRIKYTCYDTNQTDKAKEQKLR